MNSDYLCHVAEHNSNWRQTLLLLPLLGWWDGKRRKVMVCLVSPGWLESCCFSPSLSWLLSFFAFLLFPLHWVIIPISYFFLSCPRVQSVWYANTDSVSLHPHSCSPRTPKAITHHLLLTLAFLPCIRAASRTQTPILWCYYIFPELK